MGASLSVEQPERECRQIVKTPQCQHFEDHPFGLWGGNPSKLHEVAAARKFFGAFQDWRRPGVVCGRSAWVGENMGDLPWSRAKLSRTLGRGPLRDGGAKRLLALRTAAKEIERTNLREEN